MGASPPQPPEGVRSRSTSLRPACTLAVPEPPAPRAGQCWPQQSRARPETPTLPRCVRSLPRARCRGPRLGRLPDGRWGSRRRVSLPVFTRKGSPGQSGVGVRDLSKSRKESRVLLGIPSLAAHLQGIYGQRLVTFHISDSPAAAHCVSVQACILHIW